MPQGSSLPTHLEHRVVCGAAARLLCRVGAPHYRIVRGGAAGDVHTVGERGVEQLLCHRHICTAGQMGQGVRETNGWQHLVLAG